MFSNKRYVLMLQPTKSCQLSFHELLAYSLIVYRSGHGKGTTQRKLTQEFGLAKGGRSDGKLRGIAKTITQLHACDLVEKQGRLLYAKQPPQGWFHYKKNTNLPWQKRLSNFPMYRLQRDAGDQRLTNLQNAVLCLLHSWQKRITTTTQRSLPCQTSPVFSDKKSAALPRKKPRPRLARPKRLPPNTVVTLPSSSGR